MANFWTLPPCPLNKRRLHVVAGISVIAVGKDCLPSLPLCSTFSTDMTPPRMAPGQRGGSPYTARGAAPQQHGYSLRGRGGAGRGGGVAGPQGSPSVSVSSAVQAVGVRRPGFGTAGRATVIRVNACEMNIPDITLVGVFKICRQMHRMTDDFSSYGEGASGGFQLEADRSVAKPIPRRIRLYTSHKLNFGAGMSRQLNVTWTEGNRASNFKITLTEAREISMEILRRYTAGQQSWDENVSTALTALNIVLRMEPSLNHPFRVRSFFNDKIKAPLGNMPLEAWQGYFQSVRPALNRLIVNLDISTGVMFKPGSLVETCVEFFSGYRRGEDANKWLRAQSVPLMQRRRLQTFLFGVKVEAQTAAGGKKLVTIHKLTERDAASTMFTPTDGAQTSVAQTPKGAVIPLERCYIVPGQLCRAELNPDATRASLSQTPPWWNDIRSFFLPQVLAYGQSRYVRDFGLDIKTSSLPMEIPARIINPPELNYGLGSKQATVRPKEGSWNLVDKKFTKPMSLGSWIVVIFVPPNRFSADNAKDTIKGLVKGCEDVGMQVPEKQPLFVYKNPQSIVDQSIFDAVMQNRKERNTLPTFILCILPDGSNADLHTAVKNCGDIKVDECKDAGMNPPPKITFIVVGKRHHIKGFGKNDKDSDSRSGNLLPGTVVDQGITNPIEFDFYLWSHGSILGTSRCSHYNVVHDDFGFNVDVIQALSNTLCYTYARSTRSVSIPTPVYYAHIVCSRAKTHYDPQGTESSVVSGGSQTREETLDSHRGQYRPVHEAQAKRMYFMVSDALL
ncbi:hypothetical protein ARMSODRAFT_1024562 [Armillaria solidipes]|uniref:Piwi domain-containing protein n=1 Tax=Armillaria solidipes TaxID=1076256 RepID=A0A2H3BIA9_9AGAR|nr:hypothetical protein ARMSODRAFT_1024562 [Armillaria solidipes]